MTERQQIVVVGAGVHGLCAALELRRRGREVLVLDRFAEGHDRGGSHGDARITRASYRDRRYVELSRRMHREAWPRLEAELGQQLVHATPGIFFGPADGPFRAFLDATLAADVEVEELAQDEAAARFGMLRFERGDRVMLDHTAGVLAAARTLDGLRGWLRAHGVEVRHSCEVTALRPRSDRVEVVTEGDTGGATIRAARVVVAAGAWIGQLLPEWRPQLITLRQEVGYVEVEADDDDVSCGRFPVWCRIGGADEAFDYGLPQFGRPGLKLAQHRTSGAPDDLGQAPRAVDEEALLARARRRLHIPVRGLHGAERCLYSVAPGEHLHVAASREDPRVVAVAACSGHGFKFGPVLAERVADLVTACS